MHAEAEAILVLSRPERPSLSNGRAALSYTSKQTTIKRINAEDLTPCASADLIDNCADKSRLAGAVDLGASPNPNHPEHESPDGRGFYNLGVKT
jgi:hypothetical protein